MSLNVELFFDGREWTQRFPHRAVQPWLSVHVLESAVGLVRFAPVGSGVGQLELGEPMAEYFADDSPPPGPIGPETQGLADCLRLLHGRRIDPGALAAEIEASRGEGRSAFVEDHLARLLEVADLPVPDELLGA